MTSSLCRAISSFSLAMTFVTACTASVLVTFEPPGVQETQITPNPGQRLFVEDFDSRSPETSFDVLDGGTLLATYTSTGGNLAITPAGDFGGAGGTGNYLAGPSQQYVVTLESDQTYFGLWWSAGDTGNEIDFFLNGSQVFQFTSTDVLNSGKLQGPPGGHFGNPNNGAASGESFAFLNFFFQGGDAFDELRFRDSGFESDNHTFAESFDSTSGSGLVDVVPEPSSVVSFVLLLGALGVTLGYRRWRGR